MLVALAAGRRSARDSDFTVGPDPIDRVGPDLLGLPRWPHSSQLTPGSARTENANGQSGAVAEGVGLPRTEMRAYSIDLRERIVRLAGAQAPSRPDPLDPAGRRAGPTGPTEGGSRRHPGRALPALGGGSAGVGYSNTDCDGGRFSGRASCGSRAGSGRSAGPPSDPVSC